MDDTVADLLYPKSQVTRSLSQDQKQRIYQIFKTEQSKDSDQDTRSFQSCMQASIYLVCLESQLPFNFSQILDANSQLHNFMISLKATMSSQTFAPRTVQTVKKLIKSYAISLMNYKKIEEILEKFGLQGNFEHIIKFNQAIWMFFVVLRKFHYNSTEVLSDCGCLIISVICLFVSNLPEGLSHVIKVRAYDYLCETFRTGPGFVESFKRTAEEYALEVLSSFKAAGLSDCLQEPRIQQFLEHLSGLCESKVGESDLDERLVRNVVFNNELLLTPVSKRTARADLGEVNGVSLATSLKDLDCHRLSSLQIQTPITASMECNSWISRTLEEFSELSLAKSHPDLFSEIRARAEAFSSLVSGPAQALTSPARSEDIVKLYYLALESLVKIEKSKGNEVSGILQNDKFHRALFACSAETIAFIFHSSSACFEDLIKVLDISAFDFWKNIKSFTQFNIRMPGQVKKHFADLEEKILAKEGWNEGSPVSLAINRMTSENFASELSHPSFGQFFKSVLSYSGFKISQICNFLNLQAQVQEKIWSTFKYFLSEKTEHMVGRHLDQVITCSIYAVCKVEKIVEITFQKIFDGFHSVFMAGFDVFEKVKMKEGEVDNLIGFYNKIFIELVKDHLVNKVSLVNPRISSLHPLSPLKVTYNSFQSPRQAFMTPRTKKLYAFGEHSSHAVESINHMIHSTARKLDFSAPVKKPKIDQE